MRLLIGIRDIFWNCNERRLRAFLRLSLHTVIMLTLVIAGVLLLTSAFSAVLMPTRSDRPGGLMLSIVEDQWVNTIIIPGATCLGVLGATVLSGKWVDRRKISEFGFRLYGRWWVDFAFGLSLGAFLMGVIFLIGQAAGQFAVTGYFRAGAGGEGFLIGFMQSLIFFIFVGIYEEILSRGYHLINLAEGLNVRWLGKRSALVLAWVISSVMFGLLHATNPNATLISTLNLSLAGIFLGLGMVLTGSLAIPIGLHITWNFFQGNVFGFAVSGMPPGASIIATEPIGTDWMTGGLFGPEAGLLGFFAMAIGSGLIWWWVRRRYGKVSLQFSLADYSSPEQVADQCEPVEE